MCNSSKKFQELVKQIKALQENEKGQLKGGFITFRPKIDREPSSAGDGVIICCNNKIQASSQTQK